MQIGVFSSRKHISMVTLIIHLLLRASEVVFGLRVSLRCCYSLHRLIYNFIMLWGLLFPPIGFHFSSFLIVHRQLRSWQLHPSSSLYCCSFYFLYVFQFCFVASVHMGLLGGYFIMHCVSITFLQFSISGVFMPMMLWVINYFFSFLIKFSTYQKKKKRMDPY